MKRLIPFLMLLVVTLLALPAAAVLCTNKPIITGNVGYHAPSPPNNPYIDNVSAGAFYDQVQFHKSDGSTGPIEFGPDQVVHFGAACTSGCETIPSARITRVNFFSSISGPPGATHSTRFYFNGVRVFEVQGLEAITSWGAGIGQSFSDGVSVIRQDTGSNSQMYFEGWHTTAAGVTYWKSAAAVFRNDCGYIATQDETGSEQWASLGFEIMPNELSPLQWWQKLG